MPRTKRAGKRGGHSGGTPAQGASRNNNNHFNGHAGSTTSFVPFNGAAPPRRDHNGLTLQDEARNTDRHHSFWNTDQRLRDMQVTFVSAGSLDSTRPQDPEDALAAMTIASPQNEDRIEVYEEDGQDEDSMKLQGRASPLSFEDPAHNYIVDIQGDKPIDTGLPPPRLRSVSPVPSDSSEEIILFGGRDRHGEGLSRAKTSSRIVTDPIEQKIREVDEKIHQQEELLEEVEEGSSNAQSITRIVTDPIDQKIRKVEDEIHKQEELLEEVMREQGESVKFQSREHPKSRTPNRGRKSHYRDDEDAALVADYIANMDKDDEVYESFNRRELGGTEDELWQDTDISSGNPVQKSQQVDRGGWDRSDICDFDDLSTSDGVMGDVQQILSKRDRRSGTQYLVVWEGETVDGSRWVPSATLTSVNALSHIRQFEAEEKLVAEFMDADEDTSDSEDSEIGEDDVPDDLADNEDLEQRKIDRMSDEQIARLLAKQEELGMGSDQLLLFNDNDDDGDDDLPARFPSTFNPVMLSSKKSPGSRGSAKRPRGDFPSATMVADAYDGFDVMDFDRPSLKKKPKGRKGKFEADISDSELEASMGIAWENDRMKKKERKQEREKLRALGLLGSKNGKPDLKQKYIEEMGIESIREEIKDFLMGDNTTLSLPPMDKTKRKVVHELANAFKLKSKSAGDGNTRFPILYKTSRTSAFVEHAFDAVEARLTRRYFPRMDVGGKKSSTGRGGGFNNAGVSYRDGDIVGGSAPELAADNKGRAMLEKMGWSSGTALGALNNKGILQPVSHVVKTTKAGLG